jgi:DNA-binding transcriptional LysR family regulator
LANIDKLYCNIRNNHMDRLDELAIFVAVAEQGSFVAAARRLGRSPSAVTRAVAALEDRLAVRLFNRTTRSVATTDAGARYLDLCRRAPDTA